MGTSSEEAVTTDLDYTEPEEPSTELAPVLVGGGGGGIGGGGIGGGGGGGGGGIGGGGFGDAGDPATRSSLKQKLLRKGARDGSSEHASMCQSPGEHFLRSQILSVRISLIWAVH